MKGMQDIYWESKPTMLRNTPIKNNRKRTPARGLALRLIYSPLIYI